MKTLVLLLFSLSLYAAGPVQCPAHRLSASQAERKCSHQQKVEEWWKWRESNPNAHSRYRHGDHVHIGVLKLVDLQQRVLSFTAIDDEEPDPDPGFGGCGCSPDVALSPNGCGWWMSNVYGITSLVYR